MNCKKCGHEYYGWYCNNCNAIGERKPNVPVTAPLCRHLEIPIDEACEYCAAWPDCALHSNPNAPATSETAADALTQGDCYAAGKTNHRAGSFAYEAWRQWWLSLSPRKRHEIDEDRGRQWFLRGWFDMDTFGLKDAQPAPLVTLPDDFMQTPDSFGKPTPSAPEPPARKLSKAQLRLLRQLSADMDIRKYYLGRTHYKRDNGTFVADRTVGSLKKDGLIQESVINTQSGLYWQLEITDAGRQALAQRENGAKS